VNFPSFNADVAKVLPDYTRGSPFAGLLGIEIVDSRPGELVARIPITDKLGSGVGAIHGGVLAALVDHSLSLAVYPLVEIGKWVATLEMKMNYLAPIPAGAQGFIVAETKVLTLKKRIAVARVDVSFGQELVATATGTVYVRELRAPP
jgi:uncharacterized protein (TIGR00369 family)